MNIQAKRTKYCYDYCRDYHRCKVYWGAECKRQGGKRIPRMKSPPREFYAEPEANVITRPKPKAKKPKGFIDTIRTRVAGW